MCKRLLTITKKVAEIDERKRYAEPETQQNYHCAEGNRARALLTPYEEIQKEARREDNTRIKSRCLQSWIAISYLIETLMSGHCKRFVMFAK